MQRRTFNKLILSSAAVAGLSPALFGSVQAKSYVRLGGPVFDKYEDPQQWIAALKKLGYRAAYCPVGTGAAAEEIRAYEKAAREADIVIAEVGAWSNPISGDEKMRNEAIRKCVDSLALADAIGANCCVNISGSKNPEKWDGPHEDNFSEATFEQIVEVTRNIIDEVQPSRTYFALEPMPWIFPDSADAYLRLIKAIGRKQFGVHMDPVNIVVSPQLYFSNGAMIRDFIKKLGPHIRSCHGKDIVLSEEGFPAHLTECRPGLGRLDYVTFLTELTKLKDIPLMLEHLKTAEEYQQAASYIRSVGEKEGIVM